MTSIASASNERAAVREAVPVPAWLAAEFAGLVSADCVRRFDVTIPDGAMPGLVVHLQGWLNNVGQGSMMNPEYAAFLELMRRGQGWCEEEVS